MCMGCCFSASTVHPFYDTVSSVIEHYVFGLRRPPLLACAMRQQSSAGDVSWGDGLAFLC